MRVRRRGYCRFECVPITDEHHLLHTARQRGVDQSTVQQAAPENWYDHPFELAALSFLNRDGVSQIDAVELLLRDFLPRTIERAQQAAFPVRVQNLLDPAQRAVPQLFPRSRSPDK